MLNEPNLGGVPLFSCGSSLDGGWLFPRAGTLGAHLSLSFRSDFSSMDGISPIIVLGGGAMLMVEKDDILEWHPDCVEGEYDERLLWLSENLCLGDLGLPMGEMGPS